MYVEGLQRKAAAMAGRGVHEGRGDLDLLTTTHTSLTIEAREAIPLLYENPEAVLRCCGAAGL